MRSSFFAIIAITFLCVSSSAAAQGAPDLLSFQGFVTDPGGIPINHPGISIRFRLTQGSSQVWRETQPSVKIVDGIFNVLLGSVVPLDTVRFDRPLLLKIKVGTDSEILPHTPLAAVAYAKALPGLYTFYHDNGSNQGYNVIGGAENNFVGSGVVGATIGGGGGFESGNPVPDSVLADNGTVGGGIGNTVSAKNATIGGGRGNTASDGWATVGGGSSNTASGSAATVGGGSSNDASGRISTIPGGLDNSARGFASFAAGSGANANHDATFVWNTSIVNPVGSTGPNQFLIIAAGGVGIGTNSPTNGSQLHVEHGSLGTAEWGLVLSNSAASNNRTGMRLTDAGFFEITNKANIPFPDFARLDSGGNWTVVSDRRLKTEIEPASDLLQAALALEPVRYYFKNQNEPNGKSLGLIAQQVQEVVPSLVTDGDPLTMNYAGLSVVAIGAIQGLYELVQEQQILLAGLQAENELMRAAMERAGID